MVNARILPPDLVTGINKEMALQQIGQRGGACGVRRPRKISCR